MSVQSPWCLLLIPFSPAVKHLAQLSTFLQHHIFLTSLCPCSQLKFPEVGSLLLTPFYLLSLFLLVLLSSFSLNTSYVTLWSSRSTVSCIRAMSHKKWTRPDKQVHRSVFKWSHVVLKTTWVLRREHFDQKLNEKFLHLHKISTFTRGLVHTVIMLRQLGTNVHTGTHHV